MIRLLAKTLLCICFIGTISCSKRERSDPNAKEWSEIQALADDTVPVSVKPEIQQVPTIGNPVPKGEFDHFFQQLEEMKSVDRQPGETLLTGETLVFDYDRHFVRMDQDVVVIDDRGELRAESIIGRFSASNEVEYIEASGGMELHSEGREAAAETGIYNYKSGFVQLEGHATASDGSNRLSGERIQLWIKGDRKMVCEPNALLEISGASGVALEGLSSGTGSVTEVRADRVVYAESKGVVELKGNVRLRDPRAAMNCEKVLLYLKDNNEIDWIDALGEVIIQSVERKALADRATYLADEGKFTLEGDPKVKLGLNVMTGDRIIFWHETRRMVCEPNARVLLYLDEETNAKFMKDLNE